MKNFYTYIGAIALLCFISLFITTPLYGQEDTTRVNEGVTIDKGWNAMNYTLQKRYRPEGEVFESKKFSDNTFISLSGIGFGLIGNENMLGAEGVNYNLGFGKWFNKSNAVRLELGAGRFYRTKLSTPNLMAELMVLHQFNLSSYLRGYREGRFCEISTVEGLSGVATKVGDVWGGAAGVHLGMNFNFRLSKRFDLFIEPMFSFYTAGIDPVVKEEWHKYDLSYRYTMGFKYNFFKSEKRSTNWLEREYNGYMFYGGGVQTQNSNLVWKEVGVMNSLGLHAFVGAGSWVKDFFGIRGSLFYGSHIWTTYKDFGDMSARYMGMRVEVALDPLYLINKKPISERRFTLALLLGPELGYLTRFDVESTYSTLYIGGTVALQPNVKLTKNVGLFIEPRFSIVPYHVHESSLGGIVVRNRYFDGIFNLSLGFTYSL